MTNDRNCKDKDNNIFVEVTEQIIRLLESHQAGKYQKCWINITDGQAPNNPYSNIRYKGVNPFILSMANTFEGFSFNRWLTFLQVQMLGGKIIKGSHATNIYFKNYQAFDKSGKPVKVDINKLTFEERQNLKIKGFLKRYHVFNLAQIEGLGEAFYQFENMPENKIDLDTAAENLIVASGAEIRHMNINRAYYRHGGEIDEIHLPKREQFKTTQGYYETVFHELSHWTGHESRLNRQPVFEDAEKNYAFEELVAELSAAYILAGLGVSMQISNEAAYIESWLQCLNDDNFFIIRAASQATKAADFILNLKEVTEDVTV